MYERLYPSRYKNRLYSSQYKGDEGGNNKALIMVWLEIWLKAKNDSILGSRDF